MELQNKPKNLEQVNHAASVPATLGGVTRNKNDGSLTWVSLEIGGNTPTHRLLERKYS